MADGRHVENRYGVITLPRMTDSDEIWCVDGKSHADDSEKVKIETGSRISIWRPFVFRTGSSNISTVD